MLLITKTPIIKSCANARKLLYIVKKFEKATAKAAAMVVVGRGGGTEGEDAIKRTLTGKFTQSQEIVNAGRI